MLRGKWESVQCFKGDSCSSCHELLASGNKGKGQRRKGRSSSPASHSKAKLTDGEGQKSSQGSGNKHENSSDESEIPCRFKFCKNPSESEGKANKKSKKGGAKGSVATLKESVQLGCVCQVSCSRKSILREQRRLGSKHTVKFSKGTWHQIKIRERKGPSRGINQKCPLHERLARRNSRRTFTSSRIRTLRFIFLLKQR